MNEQRLITSYDIFSPEIITEGIDGQKKMLLKGILQKADTLNQNGRVYPRTVLEREIRNYQKFILENRALGELDHPDHSTIELKNVSHVIREAKMDDAGTVHGIVEVLNTPCGKIVQSLIESGIKVGISSRGVGSTKKEGDYQVVQSDYLLLGWDFVQEPSTPNAFMLPEGRVISQKELNSILNRSDRIARIVNEILSQ